MSRFQKFVIVVMSVMVLCVFGTIGWVLFTRATAPTDSPAVVLERFRAAGLSADNVRPLTKEDYGLAPFVCEGQRFEIPALGDGKGGRVFVCASNADRDALKAYYDKLGKSSAAFFSWVFVKDKMLVQINGQLDEATAKRYEAALLDQ